MNETIELRFRTSLAGVFPTRPGRAEVLDFQAGETYSVERELAAKWIGSGIADRVVTPRTVEVEQATREPRAERAIRLKPRRR